MLHTKADENTDAILGETNQRNEYTQEQEEKQQQQKGMPEILLQQSKENRHWDKTLEQNN